MNLRLKQALQIIGLAAILISGMSPVSYAQERVVALVFPNARLSIRVADGLEAKLGHDARLTDIKVIAMRVPKSIQDDLAKATSRHLGQRMQLMVGCDVAADAVIREPIHGGTFQLTIDGDLDAKVQQINAGAPRCDKK